MDVTSFYKEVFEDTLGLDVLGLESIYPQLVKLINRRTLKTFSTYIPCKYLLYLNLADRNNVIPNPHDRVGVEYYLNDDTLNKFQLPIKELIRVNYINTSAVDPYDPRSADYFSWVNTNRQNLTLDSLLMGSEYTYNRTLTDFAVPFKKYEELRGSHILYLKNYFFDGTLEITVKTDWPNVVSIPEEYREIFIKLSVLDIKIRLYNELKYLEDVVTPAGNLNLKVSDWDSAYRDREDYLRDLKRISFPDRIGDKFFRIV